MKKQYPFAHNIVIGMQPVPYHAYHKYQRTIPLPTYYGTIFLIFIFCNCYAEA